AARWRGCRRCEDQCICWRSAGVSRLSKRLSDRHGPSQMMSAANRSPTKKMRITVKRVDERRYTRIEENPSRPWKITASWNVSFSSENGPDSAMRLRITRTRIGVSDAPEGALAGGRKRPVRNTLGGKHFTGRLFSTVRFPAALGGATSSKLAE